MSHDQQRGPAPDDRPREEKKDDLANSGEPLTKPEAPDGYPDEEQQVPQLPPKTDAKPKAKPTEQGN